VLKKSITYKNPFDEDEEFTEDHYFHLQESDIVELQVQYKAGWIETMTKYIADGDNEKILEALKNVILKSYGKRSENGRIHIKNDSIREEFLGTAAYSALLIELLQNTDLMIKFFNGIVPTGISDPKVTNLSVVPDETVRVVTAKELEAMSSEDLAKLGVEIAARKVVLAPSESETAYPGSERDETEPAPEPEPDVPESEPETPVA
jgi:hypothetical protein